MILCLLLTVSNSAAAAIIRHIMICLLNGLDNRTYLVHASLKSIEPICLGGSFSRARRAEPGWPERQRQVATRVRHAGSLFDSHQFR